MFFILFYKVHYCLKLRQITSYFVIGDILICEKDPYSMAFPIKSEKKKILRRDMLESPKRQVQTSQHLMFAVEYATITDLVETLELLAGLTCLIPSPLPLKNIGKCSQSCIRVCVAGAAVSSRGGRGKLSRDTSEEAREPWVSSPHLSPISGSSHVTLSCSPPSAPLLLCC